MNPVLFYLLQVIIASGILYGYYHLLLRNKRFHQYNRFYLIASVVISIIIPFLHIPVYFSRDEIHSPVIWQTLQTISYASPANETVGPVIPQPAEKPGINWQTVLYIIYIIAITVLVLRTLTSLYRLKKIIKNNPVEKLDGIYFISTIEPGTPYSFFKWLFWNKKIELHSAKGEQIFRHEVFHIQQKHSLDIIFLELVSALFWINPFFHLIKKEQKAIHEFLADQFALRKCDRWEYAELLLMQALQTAQRLVNPFFHNQIKRRIAMITNPSKTSHRYLRKLLVLPVTAFVVVLFAFQYRHTNDSLVNRADENITIVIDAGHGGVDPGAKSPDNRFTEAEINLAIAKMIKALAGEYNINVVMTRENDHLPGDATEITKGLENRVKIANNINPFVLVSIHLNSSLSQDKKEFSGVDAFISKNKYDAYNEKLASAILGEIAGIYRTRMEIQNRDHGVFVLENTSCPSILLECGYISHPDDIAFITSHPNQEKMARAILAGIVKFANDKASVKEDSLRDTVPQAPEVIYQVVKAPAKKSPTAEQLKTWMDAKTYGVWVDEKRIGNAELGKYKPSEFGYYNVSKLEKNARNYGKHYYQVDLMTHKYYEKSFPGGKAKIIKMIRYDSSYRPPIIEKVEKSLQGYKLKLIDEKTHVDSTHPLIVIDGKQMPGLTIAKIEGQINVNDILSINVFKDGEATAKYGQAGKHGVIDIVTKKNKQVQAVEVWVQDVADDKDDNVIFEKSEIEPSFPGGSTVWMKYFERNLNPDVPVENNAPEGSYTVWVQFVVKKDGSISDVKALTNHGFGMEQEAIRSIKNGPNWLPAIQNGRKVNAFRKMQL
ncbi:MAG TPA: N-acetylmuramoyl-L-alanine amidase, partial [Chitinophagaceae bacterium]|nr:N-acetylmuramoyl-L-alanine amidase [Chitinophagaceae bacterium]